MRTVVTCCLLLTAFLALYSSAIFAAEPPQTPEDRLLPGEASGFRASETVEAGENPSSEKPKITPEDIPAVLIRAIKFEGVDAPEKVADAARPFIARTLSLAVLESLTDALTDAYQHSNIALFTIVIPEQDFEDGVVRVLIAEGWIDGVTLTGEVEKRKHTLVTAVAERLAVENPLTRKTLERQLSLIRDIPGLKTDPSFVYGTQSGAVELELALDYQRPTVSAGFSNRSSRFIKDGQFTAEGKAYRLLRDGDLTSLKLAAAVNFEDSLYAALQHSTPVGSNGARADVSAAVLRSRPNGTVIEGDAQLYSAGISYPLIRSYRENLSVRAGFDVVNSDNAAFGATIATEQTRALGLSGVYSRAWKTRSLKLTALAKQGLSVLDADVSTLIGEHDYLKFRMDGSFVQKIGDDIRIKLNAAAQWTDDNLPANERFNIGGAQYGRAFSAGLINADRGFAVLIEPAWRPFAPGPFDKSEVFVFADYADTELFGRASGVDLNYNLGSYGGGVRAAYKDNGYLELELSHPYDQPVAGYDQDWRFSLTWRLNIRP
ncbi:ShlB/FhaC/HecB family hemolysin secretion/activation protein [Hyphococcus flavus]|uniref:ShlB/FhaC/HecB family hemolysin secretion/activation protein n=1 Tax=Hyphococcus flavus TaxID=1866326 RepID=A0AAE9ZCR0_9PROT|nr:ShlB/FhaC/HecB family hemolysin secretion/activation protein [Hyphococcus flavus]WDI32513.1 ShlB/FhaC/HecB family hemolysin secretion/activation protein [Hyphococcus flavus]